MRDTVKKHIFLLVNSFIYFSICQFEENALQLKTAQKVSLGLHLVD